MSARAENKIAEARPRRVDPQTMAAVSPLPPPQEVFLDWLMSVPVGVSLEIAAQRQIELIDRRGSLHPDVRVLRTLLAAIACSGGWPKPVSNL